MSTHATAHSGVDRPDCTGHGHQRFLPGFSHPIGRTWQRSTYVANILAATAFSLLLPLIYIAVVGGSAWLLLTHFGDYPNWFDTALGGFAHVLVTCLGVLWLISLLKPLFANGTFRPSGARLTREEEPELYECVDRVFNTVGVTPPRFIEIDHEANASARLGDTFWDLWTGKVSVVTIGLPLVAALDEAQFVGVLGHECGHFRQRFGMRLSTLTRWIVLWLGRLVYQHDQWDDWIKRRITSRSCVVCYILRVFIWTVRRLLWLLLMVGRWATASLLRQMELDADRYEVRLVGIETFERTVKLMRELAIGQETAIDDMLQAFRDGRLTDNYPQLVVLEAAALADKLSKQLSSAEEAERLLNTTHWLDSHPCDGERVRNAQAERTEVTYAATRPASDLFSDFNGLCHDLTAAINSELFGVDAGGATVVPLEDFVAKNHEELDDLFALKAFFSGQFNVDRGIRTPANPEAGGYFGRAMKRLRRSAQILHARHSRFVDRASRFHQFDTMLRQTYGLTVYTHSTDPSAGAASLNQSEEPNRIRAHLRRLDGQLATYERMFWVWIESALQLLKSPIAGEISAQAKELAREIKLLWTAAAKLYEAVPHFRQLRHDLEIVESLIELSQEEDLPEVKKQLEKASQRIASELRQAQDLLEGVIYPFERKPVRSISCYVFEKAPREEQSALAAAYAFVDRFPGLYARVIGRLTRSAQLVQSAVR